MLQTMAALPRSNQKAENHADCRHQGFGLANAMATSTVEDKGAQGSRVILCWLIPKCLKDIDERQPIRIQGGCGCAAVRCHPVTKRNEQLRFGRRWWAWV